ncbi:MAG: diguanylate cyclase [Mariprofundus sp.]|nr:diguanylate cyclase [Mariprofundus sp.]
MNKVQSLEENIHILSTPPFRILLVDDQAIIAAAIKMLLADADDLELIVCDKGVDAVRMASDMEPTVILQDLIMPDMSGMQLLRFYRLCDKTADIPVIVLSSNEDAETKAEAFESGANDYLVKLPQKAELVARLRYHAKAYIEHLELHMALEEVRRLSNHDGLTDIPNRRYFDEMLAKEFSRAQREQTPLSVALIDIDNFKLYNDNYGHPLGDKTLIQVAQALRDGAHRPADFVARYGGEEFTVIMPNTGQAGAANLLEKLRVAIENLAIQHEYSTATGCVSISIGFATIVPTADDHHEALLKLADEALYVAKQSGRNCTHQARHQGQMLGISSIEL